MTTSLSDEAAMHTLYYSPGAMSLAPHVVLFELGLPFTSLAFPTATGANRSKDFLRVNPTGQVPALRLPNDEVLTENAAILPYLAQLDESTSLWPETPLAQARCRERMSFIAAAVHPAFTLMFKPERWGFNDDVLSEVRLKGRARFLKMLGHLQEQHVGPFAMGGFSVVDAHQLVILLWAKRNDVDLDDFPRLQDWLVLMLTRESVQEALQAEGLWESVQ
ncbi:MAG: glutathione S-transferase [Deltaproteobacteria bacterium]|nr:glutathione S-transferase [Deltaproteobacteria bacterium]